MHTHYDNLKVSRDAPPEVIRAAYKSLSQKFHPDRHADGEEANRIMRLLNAAYDVLSDPEKRADHDRWIAVEEKREAEQRTRRGQAAARAAAAAAQAARTATQQARPQASARTPQQAAARQARPRSQAHATSQAHPQAKSARPLREDEFTPVPVRLSGKTWSYLVYAMVGVAIVVLLGDWTDPAPAGEPGFTTPATTGTTGAKEAAGNAPPDLLRLARSLGQRDSSSPSPAAYVRPMLTPRGQPWPERSGYLPGYPVLKNEGLSTLTIDNTRNQSDVFLKLVSVEDGAPAPLRTGFVRSGTAFTMEHISPGSYDVRYRSLDTGEIFRSERFDLTEIPEASGTSYARNILTLYSVAGKSKTVTIPEREFP